MVTLIVGAGPVGLTAALELRRRGRAVRIIEKADKPVGESRALGVNPRSLDILEASGATERILAEGWRLNRARLVSRGATLGTIEFAATRHRFPFMVALPQAQTARILEEAAAGLGVQVERGRAFAGVRVAGGAVQCDILDSGGASQESFAQVIGCDGARSDVRKAAGIGFPGSAYDHDWTLLDAQADLPLAHDEACFMFSAEGSLFALPFGPGVWRLVATVESPESLLPQGSVVHRILWRSRFRIAHRLADRFRSGPIFLAGDSAHIHSPAGARGMNGGIEDAATLAWLLAGGREDLYEGLRRPAARRVLAQVDRQTRQAQARGGALMPVRELLARALLPMGFVQRLAASFITALDTATPEWLRR